MGSVHETSSFQKEIQSMNLSMYEHIFSLLWIFFNISFCGILLQHLEVASIYRSLVFQGYYLVLTCLSSSVCIRGQLLGNQDFPQTQPRHLPKYSNLITGILWFFTKKQKKKKRGRECIFKNRLTRVLVSDWASRISCMQWKLNWPQIHVWQFLPNYYL